MRLNATFKTYLADIARCGDAQEESFYPALGALLDEAAQLTVLRFALRLLLLIGAVLLLAACAATHSPALPLSRALPHSHSRAHPHPDALAHPRPRRY